MRGSLAVHTTLLEQDIAHEMFRLDRPSRTIEEAAVAQGVAIGEIAKVSVFETDRGPIAAITPANVEPSEAAIATVTGTEGVRRASAGASSRHSGFLADWIPPVGHRKQIPVVIDPRLLDHDVLYASGGEPGVILKLRSEDLQRATRGVVALLDTTGLARLTSLEGLVPDESNAVVLSDDGFADVT